jgi:Skp family chaperone for outer membrane proteins
MALFKNTPFQLVLALGLLTLAAAAPAVAQAPVKIAVIDVERILLESDPGKSALQEIDVLRQQKQEQAVPAPGAEPVAGTDMFTAVETG